MSDTTDHKHVIVQDPRDNPFRVVAPEQKMSIPEMTPKPYHSIYVRMFFVFFFLAIFPIVLYSIFDLLVHWWPVHHLLPAEASAEIDRIFFTQDLLIFVLALIFVVFATVLTADYFIRPLKRLLELTRLVGEGKLNYSIKVRSFDELGELTRAFNAMVSHLRMQQARDRLVSEMKSEFISVAAHQLRTPLSAIKWTFKMLIDEDLGKLTQEQKEFLQRGYKTNENMIGLVRDLLDATRIEQGKFGYEFIPTDFITYIRKFLEEYKIQADSHKVSVVLQDSVEKVPPLNIDKLKMDLVFHNLIDNAIKYSSPGSKVVIFVKPIAEYTEITVADQGVGIPKHQMDRMFTKFFRGDNVVRMETEGSGLGLFIVRNIVKNHGGDIRVESEENRGTKVIFTIPINKDLIPKKEERFEDFLTNL